MKSLMSLKRVFNSPAADRVPLEFCNGDGAEKIEDARTRRLKHIDDVHSFKRSTINTTTWRVEQVDGQMDRRGKSRSRCQHTDAR